MNKTPFSLLLFLSISFQMKLSIAILSEQQPFWTLRFLKVLANSLKKIFVVVSLSEFQEK